MLPAEASARNNSSQQSTQSEDSNLSIEHLGETSTTLEACYKKSSR